MAVGALYHSTAMVPSNEEQPHPWHIQISKLASDDIDHMPPKEGYPTERSPAFGLFEITT